MIEGGAEMAILSAEFRSQNLKSSTGVTIALPIEDNDNPQMPQYDKSKPFKVLYLLHGFSGNHTSWDRISPLSDYAALYNIMLVCPYGANSFYIDDDVMGAYYEQWVCEELPSLIRRVFPVSDKREDTFIGGLSMGGYGALRLGLKHSEKYGAIIALSSAIIDGQVSEMKEGQDSPMNKYSYYEHVFGHPSAVKGSDRDIKNLAKCLKDSKGSIPLIYDACGTEDMLIENNRDFHNYLLEIGISHTYTEGAGAHDWRYWNFHLEKSLDWLKQNGLI
jgi:S-formylglutathione hydrolase FrmB